MQCLTDRETADFLLGDLAEASRLSAVAHIDDCEACQKRLAEIAALRKALRPGPGELDDPTFKRDIMELIDLGRGQADRLPQMAKKRAWLKWVPAVAAAVILPMLLAIFKDAPESTSGADVLGQFAGRGAAPSPDEWVGLTLYTAGRSAGKPVYLPVTHGLSSNAAVAVAYEDRSESPYPYLMVFAVTEAGEIFWYYPAYEDPSGNPKSIYVGKAGGRVTLKDEVIHDLPIGLIRFFGIFSHAPFDVQLVEEAVKRQLARSGGIGQMERLALKGTGQWSQQVNVVPQGE